MGGDGIRLGRLSELCFVVEKIRPERIADYRAARKIHIADDTHAVFGKAAQRFYKHPVVETQGFPYCGFETGSVVTPGNTDGASQPRRFYKKRQTEGFCRRCRECSYFFVARSGVVVRKRQFAPVQDRYVQRTAHS